MNKLLRRTAILSIITLSTFTISALFNAKWMEANFFDCENEIISIHENPDLSKKAILFSRDCGATTATSYQVIILDQKQNFSYNKSRIAFTCKHLTSARISWKDDNHLIISVNCGDTYRQQAKIGPVFVSYEVETTNARQ